MTDSTITSIERSELFVSILETEHIEFLIEELTLKLAELDDEATKKEVDQEVQTLQMLPLFEDQKRKSLHQKIHATQLHINDMTQELSNIKQAELLLDEVQIIQTCLRQIIISANNDLRFLYQLAEQRQPPVDSRCQAGVRHDLYAEAGSAATFYRYQADKDDPTGVFSASESAGRLFDQQPRFDNEVVCGLDDDVAPLVDAYFAAGDPMLSDCPGYRDELREIAANLQPLSAAIKAILVIPAYQEEAVIARTLQRYASCSGGDQLAILVFENLPLGTKRDHMLTQIELFRARNPGLTLYHIYKTFDARMPIGYIRKYATELAICIKQRARTPSNLILVGGDADCVDVSRELFLFHQGRSRGGQSTRSGCRGGHCAGGGGGEV